MIAETQAPVFVKDKGREGASEESLYGSVQYIPYGGRPPVIVGDRQREELERGIRLQHDKLMRSGHGTYQNGLLVVGGMVGLSPAMKRAYSEIRRAALYPNMPVVISGETGTGKALAANAVHYISIKGKNPPVIVNCACLEKELAASMLFGHDKGAFTGADRSRAGYISAANNGSLVFDEVCNLGLDVQAKLLTCLDEFGKIIYMPIGLNHESASNARIIATTNVPLYELVKSGKMRLDFFYRINVLNVKMPSLDEIKEDIPFIAYYCLRQLADKEGKNCNLSVEAVKYLQQQKWPGNVREVQNVIARALARAEGKLIQVRDLEAQMMELSHTREDYDSLAVPLDRISDENFLILLRGERSSESKGMEGLEKMCEKETIARVLGICNGGLKGSAGLLNLNRTSLYRKMNQYGWSHAEKHDDLRGFLEDISDAELKAMLEGEKRQFKGIDAVLHSQRKKAISRALKTCNFSKTETSRLLGWERTALYRAMIFYGIGEGEVLDRRPAERLGNLAEVG